MNADEILCESFLMSGLKKILLLCSLSLVIYPAPASAKTYINWNAGYYIIYPEDWYQVAFGTVDFFLNSQNVNPETYTYDAVLAQSGNPAFFKVPYAFLHFQPVGELSDKEIDSALDKLSKEFGHSWTEGSLKDTNRNFLMEHPVYDKSMKAVVIKSRITSEVTDKYMLEIHKFFKNGVFVLLGYSPKESYNEAKKIYLSMLQSFSDENLESVAPKDSFKIVDISGRKAPTYNDEDFPEPGSKENMSDQTKRIIYIVILVVIVAAVIVAIFIKKIKIQNKIDN